MENMYPRVFPRLSLTHQLTHFFSYTHSSPYFFFLFLSCLTGDIAFRIAEHMRTRPYLHGKSKESRVVVCDINSSMLARGRERCVGKEYAQGE